MTDPSRELRRILLFWTGCALIGYWLTLFVLTHLPPEWLWFPIPNANAILEQGGDKPVHLIAYAGLAFLFVAWLTLRSGREARHYLIAAIVVAAYAILDEVLQIPVRRTADIWDCCADWTGTGIGLAVHAILSNIIRTKQPVKERVRRD